MLQEKNPLLVRGDVGRAKPTTYSLPVETHTYGMKLKREEYGANKLTSEWHLPPITQKKEGERDFKKMNQLGVAEKVIKSNQVRNFRQNVDVRVVKKPVSVTAANRVSSEQAFKQSAAFDPQSQSTPSYGKKNRAQTPVKGIINGTYGQEAESYYRKQSLDAQARVSADLLRDNGSLLVY